MKSIVLFSLLFLGTIIVSAQTNKYPRLQTIADSISKYRNKQLEQLKDDSTKEKYFSTSAFDLFFDKYFSQLQFSRENFTEGNSATLKVDDKTSKLNLNLSHKTNSTIFSIGTSVSVSDQSGVIFSGNKPTSGTEISGSFAHLFLSTRNLTYQGPHMFANYRKRRFLLDSVYLVHGIKVIRQAEKLYSDSLSAELSLVRISDSINNLSGRITGLNSASKDSTQLSWKERLEKYEDSLVSVTEKLMSVKDGLLKLDDGTAFEDDMSGAITMATEKLTVQKQLETPGVTKFHLAWLSMGLKYRKDNYSTYDSNLVFAKRIGETPFDKWTISGGLNYLWQQTAEWLDFTERSGITSFYANFTWSISKGNNFEKIDESDVALLISRSQHDSVYQFSKGNKLRDISGKTLQTSWVHSPSLTLTPIFGKKQFVGLNIVTSAKFQHGELPVFNFHSGFLFRFKDSENDKSKVNFELFLNFQDIGDTKDSGKSVWQNKQLGVSASVPFEKVFFR